MYRDENNHSPRRGRCQTNRGMTDSLMNAAVGTRLRTRQSINYNQEDAISISSDEDGGGGDRNRRNNSRKQSSGRTTRRSSRHGRSSRDMDEDEDIVVEGNEGEDEEMEEEESPQPRRSSRRSSRSSTGSTPGSIGASDNSSSTRKSTRNLPTGGSSTYSFRNRESVRRESHNISSMGGDDDKTENDDGDEDEDDEDEGEEVEDDDDDGEEEEEEDDDEEEEEEVKKYSFRNRSNTRRELLNISEDATQNQSYKGEEERSHLKGALRKQPTTGVKRDRSGRQRGNNSNQQSDSFSYKEKRIYLGGRLPSPPPKHKHRRSRGLEGRRQSSTSRRHYDSSSESSTSSSTSDSGFRDTGRRRKKRLGSYSDEDENFREHEERRVARERDSIMPMNLGGVEGSSGNGMKDSASNRDLIKADVLPLQIDSGIGFASVGGLDSHLRALKEMVILPLLYPDVFQHFDTQPPRGVLFSGPPGCGKTLTARALANSLCASDSTGLSGPSGSITTPGGATGQPRKVSFFMRKGADCLSKWLGEGERQLRLLFEQAKRYEPSIIFFDEIDGLAPVRSVKQDQIHASIVSTLLALMDGLDSRGQVVVIGATNRPDAIDPALRRPGRFDRELTFALPDAPARRAILDIHTSTWKPPLVPEMKDWIINQTVGYCGADIKALCAEATIMSLRRAYPQVYTSNARLDFDPSSLRLTKGDFAASLSRIVPASRRASSSSSNSTSLGNGVDGMNGICSLLIQESVGEAMRKVREVFIPAADKGVGSSYDEKVSNQSGEEEDRSRLVEKGHSNRKNKEIEVVRGDKEEWLAALTDVTPSELKHVSGMTTSQQGSEKDETFVENTNRDENIFHPSSSSFLWDPSYASSVSRVMLTGMPGMCLPDIAAVATHHLTSSAFPLITLDLTSLFAADDNGGGYTPEQTLSGRLLRARQLSPSVVYFPDVLGWWNAASDAMKVILVHLMESTPMNVPILWLSTVISKSQGVDSFGVASDLATDSRLQFVLSWLGGAEIQDLNQSGATGATSLLEEITFGASPSSLLLSPLPCQVRVSLPSLSVREKFFEPFFSSLPMLPLTLYTARSKMFTAQNQKLKVSKKSLNNSDGLDAQNSQKPVYISEKDRERDRHYFREQRLFFRAALGQLFKEKRFSSLSRPVDPEQVPDYYDVVLSPMDLETMRSKVDAHLYPTYQHFIYDIEQIVYNAKLYNPTDGSSRGKSIVSAANQMVDALESHAYHNVQVMKYNVFKKCEEAYYQRYFVPPPPPKVVSRGKDSSPKTDTKRYSLRVTTTSQKEKVARSPPKKKVKVLYDSRGSNKVSDINFLKQHRNQMPSENYQFYEHILDRHQEVAEEIDELNRQEHEGIGADATMQQEQDDAKCNIDGKEDHDGEDDINRNMSRKIDVIDIEDDADDPVVKVESMTVPSKITVEDTRVVVDLSSCPLMHALHQAVEDAQKLEGEGTFRKLFKLCVTKTDGWTVNQLIAVYSKFNRVSILFQKHANWGSLMEELEQIVSML